MELTGETRIAAPRDRVWAALNDPATLARCIEGVESLERVGDDRLEGRMNAKVGPVRATFTGGVQLTDVVPSTRYTIVGEGKGGVAGFAKGSADVALEDAEVDGRPGTLLRYTARSQVGGKLAQLGSRLIEGTARSYAEAFFARLKAEVEKPEPAMVATADTPGGEAPADVDAGAAATSAALAELSPTPAGPQAAVAAPGELEPQVADGQEVERGGLPPIVWGAALVILVVILLAYLLSS